MAGFFPLFFKGYWANAENPTESTFALGLANSAASVIVGALAPFLGAVADRGSAKKRFLFLFTFLGCVMTGGLWLVARGDLAPCRRVLRRRQHRLLRGDELLRFPPAGGCVGEAGWTTPRPSGTPWATSAADSCFS